MIHFFGNKNSKIYAVQTSKELSQEDTLKLNWLFGNQEKLTEASIDAFFIGPRAAMITPWSTNAVEITQNMGIEGILRIEEFNASNAQEEFDPMIFQKYQILNQTTFDIDSLLALVQQVPQRDRWDRMTKHLLTTRFNYTLFSIVQKVLQDFDGNLDALLAAERKGYRRYKRLSEQIHDQTTATFHPYMVVIEQLQTLC